MKSPIACFLFAAITLAAQAADTTPRIALKPVATNLVAPMVVKSYPGSSANLVVVDQPGKVYVVKPDGQNTLIADLTSKMTKLNPTYDERGLLGLAFHPKFASNKRVFLFFNAPRRPDVPTDWDCSSRISEFKVTGGATPSIDLASEKILLEIDKPYFNHNGGELAFGPDGLLYISVGDGGNADDVGRGHTPLIGNAQDLNSLMGKILRIDVDHGNPYLIPSDNPYKNGGGKPEIYAYGVRNPWRMSFDQGGRHELFEGEVGQNLWEEVNIIVKNGNYGWNAREGFHYFDPKSANKSPESGADKGADGRPFIDPILEYKHPGNRRNPSANASTNSEPMGKSITGGYVYRGKAIPGLVGKYIFADWNGPVGSHGQIFVATRPKDKKETRWSFAALPIESYPDGVLMNNVTALGQDASGEVYICTAGDNGLASKVGSVWKLVPAK